MGGIAAERVASASSTIRLRRIGAVATTATAVAVFLFWLGNPHDFFDLRIYMSAMRWWADGNPLYEYAQADHLQGKLYFTYPPFAALLLRPFAAVPVGVTIAILTTATVVATIIAVWWLVVPVADRHAWPRWYAAGLAVPLAFAIEPTRDTLAFGQINMLLVVLILADLRQLELANPASKPGNLPSSRWLTGVGIGLATALKLYPGIFLAYLLLARRWRAAGVACATAAGATLLAAAAAPQASWQFWTSALWNTERIGRTDYTGNQSLLGLLSRLVAPAEPDRLVWLPLAAALAALGLWTAWRAAAARDHLTGLALTGLVGSLISPITWPHHIFWFIPALIVLVDRATGPGTAGRGRRLGAGLLAAGTYAAAGYGVISFIDYGTTVRPTHNLGDFLVRNLFVLLALVLIGTLGWLTPKNVKGGCHELTTPIRPRQDRQSAG